MPYRHSKGKGLKPSAIERGIAAGAKKVGDTAKKGIEGYLRGTDKLANYLSSKVSVPTGRPLRFRGRPTQKK